MAIHWPSLAALQPALITPVRPNTQWVGIVNSHAGHFEALRVAQAVAEQVGPRMSLYETVANPIERIRDITSLIGSKSPSETNPVGVLAFGGDKTGSDAVVGALHCIFPDLRELCAASAEAAEERMIASGIQVGMVRLGGANDNGGNHGAPENKVVDVMHYMDNAYVTSLSLGAAYLDGSTVPHIFCHSLGAGETISTVYERTVEERGKAAKRHRERIFLRNLLAQKLFRCLWRYPGGQVLNQPTLEVLIHSVVRADEKMGLPGTPLNGLGVKIFPAQGFWNTAGVFREVLWRGIKSLRGNPNGLGPQDRLDSLPDTHQPRLQVGEEMEFGFIGDDGSLFPVAVQTEGDFVARAHQIRVRALPPFPRFMVMEGSLVANLRAQRA